MEPAERPRPSSVVAGRSALPAFLEVEQHVRRALTEARTDAEEAARSADEEGARLRAAGEERLKKLVVDAEAAAMREAESRARDRVSEARARIQRWIEQAEREAEGAVEAAIDLCVDGGPSA